MFHTLVGLAGLGEIDLVSYCAPAATVELGPLSDMCRRVHVIPQTSMFAATETLLQFARQLVSSPRPLLVTTFRGQPLADAVASLAASADLVWVVRLFVAETIRIGRERMIVDLDDLESVRAFRRLALLPMNPWHLLSRLDNLKLKFIERRAPHRYAKVVLASERDRRFFGPRFAGKILAIPNGVSANLLEEQRPGSEHGSLVFVANMRYEANVDAADWFVREIFPRIRSRVAGVRLWLVGHDDHGHVRSLHNGDSIIATGRVDSVIPFVTRATVTVVPLRWGGGTRIKILESLALGTPVVSTTIGAEGLDLVPGRDIVIADTAQSFADSVVALLQDRSRQEALAAAGRRIVSDYYTWDRIIQGLRQNVTEWLENFRSRPGGHFTTGEPPG
jgi:glycosyltransferase involved in cell wall biosynthesis